MHELSITQSILDIALQAAEQHTIAEGAKIEVIEVPLRVRCLDCGRESDIDRRHIECPFCKSIRLKRLSGREFLVDSLEVDT